MVWLCYLGLCLVYFITIQMIFHEVCRYLSCYVTAKEIFDCIAFLVTKTFEAF